MKKVHTKEYLLNWRLAKPCLTMLTRAKCRAKKKNIPFDLSLEDIIIPKVCPILGIKLQTNSGRPGFYDNSPSLDRLYPSKGYTKDNIRVISNRANLLKSNATISELENILEDARNLGH